MLIEEGKTNVNHKNFEKETPLAVHIDGEHLSADVVKYLIGRGADLSLLTLDQLVIIKDIVKQVSIKDALTLIKMKLKKLKGNQIREVVCYY
jgi:hypothetical protein